MQRVASFLLFVLIGGCAAPPRLLQRPPEPQARFLSASPYPGLKRQIDGFLPDTLFPPSNAAIRIASLRSGEILYDLNPRLTFHPASNQKLFTSAAAIGTLGPGYTFTTRALIDTASPPRIYVRGSGDPLLATADIDSLAATIAAALPPGLTWTLAGDVFLFDDVQKGPGWTWDDEPDPTVMFISPLSLNGNAIEVRVRPGRTNGDSVLVTTDPPTKYVTIESSAVTSVDSSHSSLQISRKWRERTNTLTVAGYLRPADTLRSEIVSILGPEWYTLAVLREHLESRGILCAGMVLDTVPPAAREVARFSHRLDSVLTYMNRVSDNLSAENILKTMAAERFGPPGTTDLGAEIVNAYLAGLGLDTTRVVIADGSGISRYDLTSAETIVALLVAMTHQQALYPLWYNTLPVAGVNGTLSHRMKGTPAESNVRAKTGTLQGLSSLSGYVTDADGEQLVFSILMQHYPRSARAYRQVQDRIASFLAELRRSQF
jgi:D-alanyl-D-alanine carboxypeptidase/D-alanyl-D-alanine-endopeptidase (penicillin-binding protein 4)